MGLKFLNKKGWHTGSLRNIENVWKAEQKHHAEQRKLEELRKQIHEERERDEFRALQIEAGLTPRQERLEFLYDSGLSVGKSSSEGFKELDAFPRADVSSASASASTSASAPDSSKSSAPGALFEEKPQSANDAWRKLHSDPLLMIRQREQEALAKIKNNPVKMAIIRKSVEAKNKKDDCFEGEHQKVKSKRRKHSSSKHHSDSDDERREKKKRRKKEKNKHKGHLDSDEDSHEEKERRKKDKKKNEDHPESDKDSRDRARHHRYSHRDRDGENQRHSSPSKQKSGRSQEDARDGTRQGNRHCRDFEKDGERSKRSYEKARHEENSQDHRNDKYEYKGRNSRRDYESEDVERNKRSYEKAKREDNPCDHQNDKYEYKAKNDANSSQVSESNYHSGLPPKPDSYKRRGKAPQLSEEERAARLREMQMDAKVHEEQRWKRLKKADEDDVCEASQANSTNRGSSFLDAVQKSVYGAEKGGSSTIEESVRRRTHFLQNSRNASEQNAFRR